MTDDVIEDTAPRRRQPRTDTERSSNMRTRAADETDTKDRPFMDHWSPPGMLEVPPDDGEYTFRWVREAVNGVPDNRNVQMRLKEGYVRVNVADLPDDLIMAVDEDRGDGIARTGGLILMKLPLYKAEQRREYYRRRAQAAEHAVDALQGVAGRNAVFEDRGSRGIEGSDAGRMLQQLSQR